MSDDAKETTKDTVSLPSDRFHKRRYWILVALVGLNTLALFNGAREYFTWPSTAHIYLTSDHVDVTHDVTDGKPFYSVRVPLKEFPFDQQLKQSSRFALVFPPSLNLLLLLALVTTYVQRPIQFKIRALLTVGAIIALLLGVISSCEIDLFN